MLGCQMMLQYVRIAEAFTKRESGVGRLYKNENHAEKGEKRMDDVMLEIAQMLEKHPVLKEKALYRHRYINLLEYFVRKYSPDNEWAKKTLMLYKNVFLESLEEYSYQESKLRTLVRLVMANKWKLFARYSYRSCVMMDCVFINAFRDRRRGNRILRELSDACPKRYREALGKIFDALYDNCLSLSESDPAAYLAGCWEKNCFFLEKEPVKILVTATMSAGKSTLINALVGKKINRTQNDACTAKLHYIKNKPYEDGYIYEQDFTLELNADNKTLMDDNELNTDGMIAVGTRFQTVVNELSRIWLIDTPGVNSSRHQSHKECTEHCIRETKADILVYLLNGQSIGSDDDRSHLQFVYEHYRGRVLFVVNKLDNFRKGEDSVEETLYRVAEELREIGFAYPVVVPVSSAAAYLAKQRLFGEILDEDDQEEFERIARKLKKSEYQFDTYYPHSERLEQLTEDSEEKRVLRHSGLLHLEEMIYDRKRLNI